MSELQIVLPERSEDEISEGLRSLTKMLVEAKGLESSCGLGGEYGYGVNFENEVFSMHRFCWCSGYDCPWCSYSDEEGQHSRSGSERLARRA